MENDTPRRMPNVPPFVKFVCANVPMVFDDSLSYYEALCALWKYVQGMTDVINNNATLEEEFIEKFNVLSGKFDELKTYVDTYFDNLDVQEEINNKLDAMLEDGTLQEIITTYIQSNVTWTFDNVAEMQTATNLIAGSFAKTAGYYTVSDGGSAFYYITDVEPSEYHETLGGGLYAELIINDKVNVRQFGAKGDGTTDDTTAIQSAINYIYNKISANPSSALWKTKNVVEINEGIYRTTDTIDLPVVVRLLAIGNPKILVDFDSGAGIYLNSRNLAHLSYVDRNDFQTYISGNIIDAVTGSLTIEKKDSFYYGDTTVTGSIGLEVGDSSYSSSDISQVARCNLNNVNINGFETGLALNDSNLYCVTFNNFVIQENYYNVFKGYHDSTGNAGERMTFKDCMFGVARYGIYIKWGLSTLNFFNCSFDYMGCAFKAMYTNTGSINLYGGHIEGMGYINPDNNMRTRFPGDAKDWGYICYYDASNASYKMQFNAYGTLLYLVNTGTSDSGKRFGSKISSTYTDLSNFNSSVSTQQNLIVTLTDVNFSGVLYALNNNLYNTNEIFLAESGVNMNYKHGNNIMGWTLYAGSYYNDFIGRMVTTDAISNYYSFLPTQSTLSMTLYTAGTAGADDTAPYFGKALSITTSDDVEQMGVSRITYPSSNHMRITFIYKMNAVNTTYASELVQIYFQTKNLSGTTLGNLQLVQTSQYIMKEANDGWHIVIADVKLNEVGAQVLVSPRVYLRDSGGNNVNYSATMDVGGLLVDYCD